MSSIIRGLCVKYWIRREVGIVKKWTTTTCLANGDNVQLRPMPHYARSVAASRVSGELSSIGRGRYINFQGHTYILKIIRDQGLLCPDTQLVLVVFSQRG